ncbi:MAG TPA: hypothetical protein VI731_11290 [Bacteroidia bacterium]|nr:hypothetical protein [Bacteroidia bacterium]
MKLSSGSVVFALAVFFIVSGCKPDPVFPVEPVLTFDRFIQNPGSDSLQVVFKFTDGDGDIGVPINSPQPNMLLTPFHPGAVQTYEHIVIPPGDTVRYEYRIPNLSAGQKGLEGDIYVTLNRSILYFAGEDTLVFDAYLTDQAGHKSQVVRTTEVILLP